MAFFKRNVWKYRYLYLMVLPGFIAVLVFNYFPMYGIQIAFKSYNARAGIWGSKWVGLEYFESFFNSALATRAFKNTLLLGVFSLFWGFPAPILLALLINEIRYAGFKKLTQTITYFPHFISMVVVAGILRELCSSSGPINKLIKSFGNEPILFLLEAKWFRTVFIASGIWQSVGFSSIIYLAALAGADPVLYDAAEIDGANRLQKMWHISWQAIKPTTIILLIFNLGGVLNSDYQKLLLLYTPETYSVADTIGTFVYRMGLEGGRFEFTTAVGLFMSVISFILLICVNTVSKRLSETSLW